MPMSDFSILKHLSELSRSLATITTQHNETLFSHNTADHASQIVELDTQKFRIAKAASDLEIESERLEQELEGLKGQLHNLDIQGVEGSEAAKARREQDDPTLYVARKALQGLWRTLKNRRLKLKIYRSLGIDVDPDSAGNYNKAVIRNSQKGDVHVVNIDPKFSRFFYANYFWQTM